MKMSPLSLIKNILIKFTGTDFFSAFVTGTFNGIKSIKIETVNDCKDYTIEELVETTAKFLGNMRSNW